jgi:spore coat protein H
MKTSIACRISPWLTSLLLAPSIAFCAVQPTRDDLFDPNVLHQIRLSIHPSDWQKLKDDYRSNAYYPCAFEWRGVAIDAGIRSAGLGTRNEVKPALRVDFNRYDPGQEFLGLKSVRLKNLVYDASMVKERMVMSFYSRMGLAAPRTAHARLYINNEYAGLYLVVESIDKPFLHRNFDEDGGYLYEYEYSGPYRFEYLGPDPSRYVPLPFEPHTHELDPNPSGLIEMVRTMNEASSDQFVDAVSPFLDLKHFLTQLAVEMFFGEADGILSYNGLANFYLYQFTNKRAFQFIPWDKDRTFFDINDSIWRGTSENVLTRRAFESPALRQAYMEALWRSGTLAGGAGGWLEQEIVRASEQVIDAVRDDPVKRCPNPFWVEPRPCSVQDFTEEVARIIDFTRRRGDIVRRQLAESSFEFPSETPRLLAIGPVSEEGPAVLVPGSLLSVFGQGLAHGKLESRDFPLPTELGGASVFVNGIPASLLFVSPSQINLQVPWETKPGSALITVASSGAYSRTLSAAVGRTHPTLLAVTFTDGTPVSAERPARPGDSLVVFATGLGAVTRAIESGQPAPASPPIGTKEVPRVKIGELLAAVTFSGLAPGLAGVYLINTVVPEGVINGPTTLLSIAMADKESPPLALTTSAQ